MHEKLKTKTYVYQLAHFRHLNNSVFLFISSLSSSNIGLHVADFLPAAFLKNFKYMRCSWRHFERRKNAKLGV